MNNKFNIESFNMSRVVLPQFSESLNLEKKWVAFGDDNLFPEYLKSLINKSPLHSSIVTQKARMVGGYGFSKNEIAPATYIFMKNSGGNYDLDEILYRCSYDLEVYGSFAINPVWSKDGETIHSINYVDVSKLRVQPSDNDKYPDNENYWISDGWENTRKYEPVLYPGFTDRSKKKKSQILYTKQQRAGVEFYGIPDYIPGIRWMETDWLIGDFHMHNIKNGFAPSYFINIPLMGASDEERAYIAARLKSDLEGTTNAGRWTINFVDNIEDAPKFEAMGMNDSDARFMLLAEQTEKSILHSHGVVNPMLFGIQEAGKLGGRNEILEALELFQSSYLTPKQRLIEKVFNRLSRLNGIQDKLVINRYSENFKTVNTNMSEILGILTSAISPEQKFWMLTYNGYTHQAAAQLTGYQDGNKK